MEVLWRMRRGRRADCRRCERRNCVVRRVGMGETMVEVEVGVGWLGYGVWGFNGDVVVVGWEV